MSAGRWAVDRAAGGKLQQRLRKALERHIEPVAWHLAREREEDDKGQLRELLASIY